MECNVNILCIISGPVSVTTIIATHCSGQTICVIPIIDANVIGVVVIAW